MESPQALGVGRILWYALCAFALWLPATGRAAPEWVATYSPVPNIFPRVQNIVLGPDGSVYTSAYREGQSAIHAFIVKHSPAGERLWAVENTNIWVAGDLGPVPVTAVDPQGAVRIAGPWTAKTNELIVASYSAQGTLLWERRSIHNNESRPYALTVDNLGNTIVVGRSARDALIVKYSPDGMLLWTRTYSRRSTWWDWAHSVQALPSGDVLVSLQSSAVLKYNSAGELLWTARVEGEAIPLGIKLDPSGNIIAASAGHDRHALVKLTANGQRLWRTHDIGFRPAHFTVDSQGSIYVAGYADSRPDYANTRKILVAKYDAGGAKQWTSRFAPPDSYVSAPAGIAVNNAGVSLAFSFNRFDFLGAGVGVAHYNPEGVEVWRDTYDAGTDVRWMAGGDDGGIYVAANSVGALYTLKFRPAVSSALPTIVSSPQDLEVVRGTNSAVFSVETGNGPNTFQWRRDGVALLNETNAVLRLTGLSASTAGGYSVIVSNAYGFVVTPEAQLIVRHPPDISWSPYSDTNRTVVAGNELVLSPSVGGTSPLTFEWRKNGELLAQRNQMLVIDPVSVTDAGTYTIVARSPYGVATNSASLTVLPRSAIDEWRWVQAKPQGNDLRDVAFGAGRFVAVGDLGALVISTNGIDWSATNLNNLGLIGVSFGNGRFVALTELGPIYISADGLSWTQRHLTTSAYDPEGIGFLNDRFVVYGRTVQSSTDGVTWIDHGAPPFAGGGIAAGNGIYIMPVSPPWPEGILVSTNLNDWNHVVPDEDSPVFDSVAYGNGIFVLGGATLLTRDGAQFYRPNAGTWDVSFTAGAFFSLGGSIQMSADGTNWSTVSDGFDLALTSMAYGNGRYVAVGYGGTIASSTDGQNWTRVFERGDQPMRGLAYGNGRYVAITDKRIWTSPDGEDWTTIQSIEGENFMDVIWANGTFIIVDEGGSFVVSSNGIDWRHVPTDECRVIVHDGTRFVAVGERTVVLYTNVTKYTRISNPMLEPPAIGLAFGSGVYVLVNSQGVLVSSNALDWRMVLQGQGFGSVAYQNGRFVIAQYGQVSVSSNGVAWSVHPLPGDLPYEPLPVLAAASGAAMFVVSTRSEGKLATSTNGQDWVLHQTRARGKRAIYANGAWWMLPAIYEGLIRSAQIEPAIRARKTPTGVELSIRVFPGQPYRVQRATALGSWSDFQSFTPQTEMTTLTDNDTAQNAFYRILSP